MISKLVGFVMIPIYTNYLVPADYGILELLTLTTDIITILIGAGLAQAVMRLYFEHKDRIIQNSIISTSLISSIFIFTLIFGLLAYKSDLVSNLIFGYDDESNYFNLTFITMIFSAGIEIPLTFLRAKQKSISFVFINFIKLVIQLSLNIYFIVVLEYGILGVLYSGLISSFLIGGYLTISTFYSTGFNFSILRFKQLLHFGSPLIISNIGAFILTFSDRYFLNYYSDLTEVGIYSLAYKFGMLVSLLVLSPFYQYWTSEMFLVAKRNDAQKTFRDMFTYSTFLTILFCLVLSIFIPEVIKILTPEPYWKASEIVPIICLAYIFVGMFNFTSCGILITKKTRLLAYSTIIAVFVNICMNFLLISKWGAYGAAYATVGSFFIRLIFTNYFSQKEFPIKYEWSRIISACFLAISLVIISRQISIENIYITLIIKSMLVISYLVILFFSGWFYPNEKIVIKNLISNPGKIRSLMKLNR